MKLKDLKAQIPRPASMETETGKAWADRVARAAKWRDEQMADVPILTSLYAKPYTTISTKDGVVVVKIPWAKAYIDNLVADLYFRNPDLYVEALVPVEVERMVARECRDIGRALDDELRTSDHMHRAVIEWGTAGFGGIWESHEQRSHLEETGEQDVDENGNPRYDEETGTPVSRQELIVDDQRLREEFVCSRDYLLDPDGTDWIGLTDFKFIGRIYSRSLQDFLDDPEYDEPDTKARLVWYAAGFGRYRDASSTSLEIAAKDEEDVRYINVRCAEMWSAAEGRIVHVPLTGRFHLTEYDWPRALMARRRYPTRLVSDGYTVPTKAEDNPYPTPLLRHIRALIEDYVRIYDRLLNAGGGVVKRYFTFKGAFERTTFKKWANSDEVELLEIDPEKVRKLIGVEDGAANIFEWLGRMMALQPSNDTKNEILAYGAMLDRIESILWQATGQGPADRGGIAPNETATGVAAMAAKLDARTALARERVVASAYRDIHEIRFLFLAENQTLPIPYVSTTPGTNESVWRQFQADMIRGVRLSFRTAVGSAKPPTREQRKVERLELFGKIAPFLEQIRQDPFALALVLFTLEPYDATDVEDMLRRLGQLVPMAKEFMELMLGIRGGQLDPTSPEGVQAAARQQQLATMMSQGILGPGGINLLASGPSAPSNPGNVRSIMSGGQRRAAEAAAGATQ